MEWHEFLHQLFDGDLQSLELRQEWFGYALVADTSQQKMLLMVGPKRGGKGTIARVLRQLIGEGNVAGPTTSSLAGAFGLQPLIGKSLAIVSDARFSGDGITTVIERLLTISGEDAVSIDRKYLSAVTMKLPTRFMFLTNEFPRLSDASGALAGRFVILQLTRSFYGQEDTGLTKRLMGELPGILNWAIEGWKRLRERGHFVMPASCAEAMRELEELSSPVQAFVREACVVAPGASVEIEELFAEWQRWCALQGRTKTPNRQILGRDLKAAFPQLICRRGTSTRFYDGIGLRRNEPC
jgi:putative DNA primase/helicase